MFAKKIVYLVMLIIGAEIIACPEKASRERLQFAENETVLKSPCKQSKSIASNSTIHLAEKEDARSYVPSRSANRYSECSNRK